MQLRPAVEDDLDQMIEVMYAEPSVEQVAFMPTLAGARRFTRAMWLSAGLDQFVVAEDGGEVVGLAWWSESGISMRAGARAAASVWGLAGPLRMVAKGWPRQRVEFAMPPGPKLLELQAHPSRRGTGVGSALLEYLLSMAGGRSVSLTTRSDSRARHLYERHGFAAVAEKRSRAFERRTGSPGRILMVRPASG